MRLKSFTVTNFRSINDSGSVEVSHLTAVLGRNESGKSNLLRALHSLNPAEGFVALTPIKDFPRHRRLEECKGNLTPVVYTRWSLDEDEKTELAKIFPRAAEVSSISISRGYDATQWVDFECLAAHKFDEPDIKNKLRKIVTAVKAAAERVDEAEKAKLVSAAEAFDQKMVLVLDRVKWSISATAALHALRKALAASATELSDKQEQLIYEFEQLSGSISTDEQDEAAAIKWALQRMPTFIYIDEYPELYGHQDVAEYLERKSRAKTTAADRNFEKLCKVAGLDPLELEELLAANDQETRNQLANRAGSVVTSEIRRLWKDRALKVRFNLDSHHLDILISDPNAVYDVEVNLDERSRGFQWFFSFYTAFCADTKGGKSENAILLLDEPGLYLHAKSQSDLLRHLEKDFENQIIYTTHSPFMVPTHALDSVRTVSIDEDKGTTVTNSPTGDARTLFPLQAALGYSISQALFIGPNNLVVEGVTDFWVLSSVSAYFAEIGRIPLQPDLTITPAGGAQKVSYMVALLSSEQLKVLVLLDHEKDAQTTKNDLVKNKLIVEQNLISISEAFGATAPKEADIEDLFDSAVYELVVRESYAVELTGKTLVLNTNIPRVAKRCELALKDLNIDFHKTRPMRLILQKMSTDPGSILSEVSAQRFEVLFKAVNEKLKKQIDLRAKPFR